MLTQHFFLKQPKQTRQLQRQQKSNTREMDRVCGKTHTTGRAGVSSVHCLRQALCDVRFYRKPSRCGCEPRGGDRWDCEHSGLRELYRYSKGLRHPGKVCSGAAASRRWLGNLMRATSATRLLEVFWGNPCCWRSWTREFKRGKSCVLLPVSRFVVGTRWDQWVE